MIRSIGNSALSKGVQRGYQRKIGTFDSGTKVKLEALGDAELLVMFEEMMKAYETMVAEGLTEEEIMTAGMEYYTGISSQIMGKVAEALGVGQ